MKDRKLWLSGLLMSVVIFAVLAMFFWAGTRAKTSEPPPPCPPQLEVPMVQPREEPQACAYYPISMIGRERGDCYYTTYRFSSCGEVAVKLRDILIHDIFCDRMDAMRNSD